MTSATYVYGAGGMGREVLAHCRALGIEPKAFIDRRAGTIDLLDGVPLIAPGAAVDDARTSEVIVALHSPGVEVARIVAALEARSFGAVRTLWSECRRTGWLPESPFWLDPHFDWDAHEDAIARARARLSDDRSQRVFDQQLALRRRGDYAGLAAPTPDDQYVPRDLPRAREPMRLLDCGAFDGDTIRAFRGAGRRVEAVLALEPDPVNFARLRAGVGDDPTVRAVMAGVASAAGTRSFDASGGTAARVHAQGTETIEVVDIDTVCADFGPTLIKMDIEGAEQDALDGAAETLVRDRPDVAISAYHRVHDLWSLLLDIDRRVPGYRFHLRSHAHNGFELVLYGYAPR